MEKHELDDDREILYWVSPGVEGTLLESDRYAWFEDEKRHYTNILRNQRNELLAESDWTQAPDSPLSEDKKVEWQTYRQTLRDITITNWQLEGTVWPQIPE
jgi:hypothetical protein